MAEIALTSAATIAPAASPVAAAGAPPADPAAFQAALSRVCGDTDQSGAQLKDGETADAIPAGDVAATAPIGAADTDDVALDPAVAALLAILSGTLPPAPTQETPQPQTVGAKASAPPFPAAVVATAVDAGPVAAGVTMHMTAAPGADAALPPTPADPARQAALATALAALEGVTLDDGTQVADAAVPMTRPPAAKPAPMTATAQAAAPSATPLPAAAAESPSAPAPATGPERTTDKADDPAVGAPPVATTLASQFAGRPGEPAVPGSTSASASASTVAATLPGLSTGNLVAEARADRWLDQLAHDIARTGGDNSRLSFTVDPARLGPLSVHIAQDGDGATVRMTTRDDHARAVLTEAQPRLVAEARAQGLTLRETSVDVGSRQQGSGQRDAAAFAQQGGGQQPHQQRRSSPDDNQSGAMVAPARASAIRPADARYA